MEKLELFFVQQNSEVGGIHFLIDATGSMGILEHEPFRTIKKQIVNTDYTVRANAPLLLQDTCDIEWEDRRIRYDQAESDLINISGDSWLHSMKELLSSHHSKEQNQIGQLCIHDFDNTGARSKDLTSHCTETALIFDVKSKKLIYSEGSPCRGEWSVLALNE